MTEECWSGAENLILGQLKPNRLFIDSAKYPECKGSTSPSSCYGSGVDQGKQRRRVQDFLLLQSLTTSVQTYRERGGVI